MFSAVFSSPQQSVLSRPQQSVLSRPQQSVLSRPQQSVLSRPQQSVLSRPQQSVLSRPQQSVLSRPQQSVLSRPQQSVLSSPQQSVLSRPQQSVLSRPQQSVLSRPQQSVLSRPQQSVLSRPQQSVLSRPQQSVLSRPQQSVLSRPSSPQLCSPEGGGARQQCRSECLPAADAGEPLPGVPGRPLPSRTVRCGASLARKAFELVTEAPPSRNRAPDHCDSTGRPAVLWIGGSGSIDSIYVYTYIRTSLISACRPNQPETQTQNDTHSRHTHSLVCVLLCIFRPSFAPCPFDIRKNRFDSKTRRC